MNICEVFFVFEQTIFYLYISILLLSEIWYQWFYLAYIFRRVSCRNRILPIFHFAVILCSISFNHNTYCMCKNQNTVYSRVCRSLIKKRNLTKFAVACYTVGIKMKSLKFINFEISIWMNYRRRRDYLNENLSK